ncbi:MAG: hypothetical protein AABX14_05225 [Candidatus Aenigmatarchaeota archaeon]
MDYNTDFAKVRPVAEEIDHNQRAYSALAAPVAYLAIEGARQLGLDLTPVVDTIGYTGAAVVSLSAGYTFARLSQDMYRWCLEDNVDCTMRTVLVEFPR